MATTVVIQQPLASSQMTNWDTGLFECCDDMSTCCYAFWCCPCFACNTSAKFGEHTCLPLLDIFSPAITAACGLPLCVPPAALALRVAVRHRYGIKGGLCRDIFTSCFCEWCSWCQMARELKKRKKAPAVLNVQTQAAPPVRTTQVQMVNQQGYVVSAGQAVVGPQPGYGVPAGFVAQPQGPVVYQQY